MQLSPIETTALQKEQFFLWNIIHRGCWELTMHTLYRISSTKESVPIRSHQAHRMKSRCQIQGDLNINSIPCAQPDGVISRSKGPYPSEPGSCFTKPAQSFAKTDVKLQWGAERKRKEEAGGWDGEAGAGGGMGGKSCFWEKPSRVVIEAAWSFLAPQCVRTGEISLCLAVQQEAKTCCLAISQSLNHHSRGITSKGGRTQVDLRELSVSFHQPSSWVTVYFISLRLSQHWPEPKKTTKELFFADLNDREKVILKNVISYCKPIPFTAS